MQYTTFEAGERQYKLKFTINSLCTFEDEYGIGITDALVNTRGIYYLRGLLWAGLLAEHNATVEQTGEIMDAYLSEDHGLSDLTKLLTEALKAAGFFRMSGREKSAEEKGENSK